MFVDKVQVKVEAGKGGDGVVAWRREKFEDRGGPNGGDGGDGGDVIFKAERNLNTLAAFRYNQLLKAKPGMPGEKQNRHGKNGDDLIIKVPVGTVVYDGENMIADLSVEGQVATVAFGGKGGFGNAHFKSSRRRAPKVAEKGEPGDELELTLELKLIADIGLVGLPNAGKSTLLSVISNARPEIADYPFTTLIPNLGVVDVGSDSVLVADIPGLIEGASKGRGLGDEFLRHVERTNALLHLVDSYQESIVDAYDEIQRELKQYGHGLSDKPQVIVLTKLDGLDKEIVDDQIKQLKAHGVKDKIVSISSKDGTGLDKLKKEMLKIKKTKVDSEEEEEKSDVVVLTLPKKDAWKVRKDGDVFVVSGRKIEKFALRTNFENEFGIRRLIDIMKKMGIMHELERQGATSGSQVKVRGSEAFEL